MAKQKPTPVTCQICGRVISREADMARHMLTHAENKEDNMYRCKYDGCKHMTLQEANLRVHECTHTGKRPLKCYIPGCNFRTAHPSSMSRHRQKRHGNVPNGNSERLHHLSDSRSTTCGQQRFSPYPHQVGKGSKRNQVGDTHLATASLDHALLASSSGYLTTSRVAVVEHQSSHLPADSRSTTRRQQRPSPYPQQVSEESKRVQVQATRLATTSQPDHALLVPDSGTSTTSITTTEHLPSYQPLPEEAGLDAFDKVVLTVINGVFDDLDPLFSDRSPNVTPVDSGTSLPSPLAQHSVVDATTPTPSPVSLSPAPRRTNDSSHSSSHSSPVSFGAVRMNSGALLPVPLVQHSVAETPIPVISSLSPAPSSVNDSLLSAPLRSPVRLHGIGSVPTPTPSLSPSYELLYGANHQPAPTSEPRILPAYKVQPSPSSYAHDSYTILATSPAAQSNFSQYNPFASLDTSVPQPQAVWPWALVDARQRHLGQSHFHATTAVANNTIYSSAPTGGGFGMQELYAC